MKWNEGEFENEMPVVISQASFRLYMENVRHCLRELVNVQLQGYNACVRARLVLLPLVERSLIRSCSSGQLPERIVRGPHEVFVEGSKPTAGPGPSTSPDEPMAAKREQPVHDEQLNRS